MAFQIADDILDVSASVDSLGKDGGTDLRAGVPTLPVIKALDALGTDERAQAIRLALRGEGPEPGSSAWHEVLALIRDAGVEPARKAAHDFVAEAHARLAVLPRGLASDTLAAMADMAAERLS